MHRDIVYDIPSGFVNLGSSHICGIQGLYQPSRVLTVQAHPEFNEFIMTRLLEKRHNDGIFDGQIFLEAISRASKSADNATVGAAVCRFLLMASS
jgi:GMP synthase (glutamine-hydrolysing)